MSSEDIVLLCNCFMILLVLKWLIKRFSIFIANVVHGKLTKMCLEIGVWELDPVWITMLRLTLQAKFRELWNMISK